MTIICLESAMEQDYSHFLRELITEARESGAVAEIALIRSFWDNQDSWEEIQEKASYEDSRWYVWWMDGVRAYIRYEQAQENVDA